MCRRETIHILCTLTGRKEAIWCLLFFLLVCLTVPLSFTSDGYDDNSLFLLHVVFRHGDRTPDTWSTYPSDPHKNASYEPYGHGQLTLKGKQTAYRLGQHIRTSYDKFLGRQYHHDTLFAKSTNFKRTKMTLLLVLSALFPPSSEELFAKEMVWQPIPFLYETGHNEIADYFYFCLNYLNKYYNLLLSSKGQNKINAYKQMLEELSNYTGLDVKIPKQVCSLHDTLRAQEDWGLKLPEWTTKFYPGKLLELCYLQHELSTFTTSLRRLSSGFLLKKILEDTHSRISGDELAQRKLYLYSTHDINVVALLRGLNVYEPHLPDYGAAIFIEMHLINGGYFVKIRYKYGDSGPSNVLTIPGCSTLCPLRKFEELIKDNLPSKIDVCVQLDEI